MSVGLFGSTLLDVVIGLVFTYLLLSIVCSAINEFVARLLQLRAKTLEAGIGNLLQDPDLAQMVLDNPLISGISFNRLSAPRLSPRRARPSRRMGSWRYRSAAPARSPRPSRSAGHPGWRR
jgi:hypothetical protein